MKIRGHGNAVAISLASLAVVIAATGTAVAVTTTVVNIADPTTPARIAHVDSSGRLTTVGAATTINAFGYGFAAPAPGGFTPVTSATTASLALTSLAYDNGYNRQYPNTDYELALVKVTVGAAGTCYDSDRTIVEYRHDSVPAGGPSVTQTFPIPLVFKATGTRPYCIGATVSYADGTQPTVAYGAYISIGAYVTGGTYTGVGTSAQLPKVAPARVQVRRATHTVK